MSDLTRKQKALLFQGKDKWHSNGYKNTPYKSFSMHDGPNGLRIEIDDSLGFPQAKPATAFPTASLIGCSFDRSLMREFGNMLAEECIESGTDILLGPGINHKRSPLCGRNFEYFAEDPVLSGELAAAYIQGVQEKKIGTSLKHLAANNREYGRMICDSVVDERTLHELYLKQYKIAVKKGHPWTIMNAYNKLNGIHCTEHKALMDEVRAWGFDGVFISDWGAVYNPVNSLRNGLNLEMPGGNIGADQKILGAIEKHSLDENVLDRSTQYLKKLMQRCSNYSKKKYDKKIHLDFAKKMAEESIVLAKNENKILPLNTEEEILLVGPFAKFPRITGAGSSGVMSNFQDNLYSAMKHESSCIHYVEGYSLYVDTVDKKKSDEAVHLAKRVDKVVMVLALPEGKETEGSDKKNLSLPDNEIQLVNAIQKVNSHIILVLQTGSPVMLPFISKIPGILITYLAGARSGAAVTSILYGKVAPQGKLAETWPLREESVPCQKYFAENCYETQYRETIFSGYRYYDTFHIPTQFSFGFGLSYTNFAYKEVHVEVRNHVLITEVTIRNTGTVSGKEIIEIYMSMPKSKIVRCAHELIDFAKIELAAGEEKTVSIETDLEVVAYYDVKKKDWLIEDGEYVIGVGNSLENLQYRSVVLSGEINAFSTLKKEMFHIENEHLCISDADYETILGHSLPLARKAYPFTPDTTIGELQQKKLGKILYSVTSKIANSDFIHGVDASVLDETCLRQMLWLKGVSWKTVEIAVSYMNKHKFSALKELYKSFYDK